MIVRALVPCVLRARPRAVASAVASLAYVRTSLGALCALALASASATAAPSAASTALTFDVSARVANLGPDGSPGAAQSFGAKVTVAGEKARVETTMAGKRSVLIYAPPTIYRLLPASRAGVRWTVPDSGSNLDVRRMLRSPDQIRTLLTRYGARKTGTAKLGGVPVDGYELKKPVETPGGTLRSARAWLRSSDALPLRFEARLGELSLNISWRNYRRQSVSSALFAPPAGFAIRSSQSPPPRNLF